MKHSPIPIGHDLIASSLVCAGKLETTKDPRQYVKLKSDANDTVEDNITYIPKTLISIAEESIPRTSNKSIMGHGSMMIVKLQSDHARQLYENSIYSIVLKI